MLQFDVCKSIVAQPELGINKRVVTLSCGLYVATTAVDLDPVSKTQHRVNSITGIPGFCFVLSLIAAFCYAFTASRGISLAAA